MKKVLRIALIVCCLIMVITTSANAESKIKDNVLNISGESLSVSAYSRNYYSGGWSKCASCFVSAPYYCRDNTLVHTFAGYYWGTSEPHYNDTYTHMPLTVDGSTVYLDKFSGTLYNWYDYSTSVSTYSNPSGTSTYRNSSTVEYTGTNYCAICGQGIALGSTTPRWYSGTYYTASTWPTTVTTTRTNKGFSNAGKNYTSAKLVNCSFVANSGYNTKTLTASVPVTINGGTYTGYPALNSTNITVVKGTITDDSSTTSTFIVGPDSESAVSTSGTKTVTTVKLINPPIIIDWADFPGIDLNCYCRNLLAECALV